MKKILKLICSLTWSIIYLFAYSIYFVLALIVAFFVLIYYKIVGQSVKDLKGE